MGWTGSHRQWRLHKTAYGLLAALMAPLVISVHSIVGLDFCGGLLPGWHSTQFSPFFVFGAVLSGFAMVLLMVVPLRRLYQLEAYITDRHLDLLVTFLGSFVACCLLTLILSPRCCRSTAMITSNAPPRCIALLVAGPGRSGAR